jgi:hypothetical protein
MARKVVCIEVPTLGPTGLRVSSTADLNTVVPGISKMYGQKQVYGWFHRPPRMAILSTILAMIQQVSSDIDPDDIREEIQKKNRLATPAEILAKVLEKVLETIPEAKPYEKLAEIEVVFVAPYNNATKSHCSLIYSDGIEATFFADLNLPFHRQPDNYQLLVDDIFWITLRYAQYYGLVDFAGKIPECHSLEEYNMWIEPSPRDLNHCILFSYPDENDMMESFEENSSENDADTKASSAGLVDFIASNDGNDTISSDDEIISDDKTIASYEGPDVFLASDGFPYCDDDPFDDLDEESKQQILDQCFGKFFTLSDDEMNAQ